MITTLYISNYALISELSIDFGPGLNIITGETGAGKSIILGALSLLLGGRADTKSVRDSNRKTIVEATFDITDNDVIKNRLAQADIDSLGDECILRREITTKGGSRAFVNDTPVNIAVLKSLGTRLVDIHSQHENMLLVDAGYQLDIIDALADNASRLDLYRSAYRDYRQKLKNYVDVSNRIKQGKAENEYLTHQLEILDRLALKDGETGQLEHDRDIIANVTEIKAHLSQAIDCLSRPDNDITSLIARAENEISRIGDYVSDVESLVSRLESARIELGDIAETLDEYNSSINADPAELEAIEVRLGEIYSLKRRYNVDSDKELIDYANEIRQKLNIVENAEDILSELEDEARHAKRKAIAAAHILTERRTEASAHLADELKKRAMPMGMTNLRCEIRLTSGKLSPSGGDSIEFLFAFNKNQPLMPVGKTASGGEISRLILALKSIVAEKMNFPTIIFDEVDTGVSGDVANRMAELMVDISATTQVITITHLPTVAAHGRRHFKVFKQDDTDTTKVFIKELDNQEREHEIAFMISGDPNDTTTLASARTLLEKH